MRWSCGQRAVGFPLWFLLAGANYAGWRLARLCAAVLLAYYTADAILLTAIGTLTVGLADCQSGPETDSCLVLPDSPYVAVPAPFAGKVVLWLVWLIGLTVVILLSLPASSRYVAVRRWLRWGSPRGR